MKLLHCLEAPCTPNEDSGEGLHVGTGDHIWASPGSFSYLVPVLEGENSLATVGVGSNGAEVLAVW